MRSSSLTSVVLPAPLRPTSATDSCRPRCSETSRNTGSGLAGVGERDLLEGDAFPNGWRHGPRRGGDRQVGRRFEHAKEAGEVPEQQRQEAEIVANCGEALLEHGGCAAVQYQVARRPLTSGHQPHDVDVHRTNGRGGEHVGEGQPRSSVVAADD